MIKSIMREEKTMLDLVKRYESQPFSQLERIGITATLLFFITMSLVFFLAPRLI
jgi:hypothetical protein